MVDDLVKLREKYPQASDYGRRLRLAMQLDGWRDSMLAGELGVSNAAIGKFWNGGTKMFSAAYPRLRGATPLIR